MRSIKSAINDIFHKLTSLDDLNTARDEVLKIIQSVVMDKRTVGVKYIGARESFTDRLYGSSLTWARDETLGVPVKIAAKLLKHSDILIQDNDISRTPEFGEVHEPDYVDRDQEARDIVMRMDDIKMIRLFVHDNFAGNELPAALKNVDSARGKAIELIDRIGVIS